MPVRTTATVLLMAFTLSSQAVADVCPAEVLNQRQDMRERLAHVSRRGLEGEHHYSISFKTKAKGVGLPAALVAQYPDDMHIILQHQFEALKVSAERFDVTLWFKGKRTRVTVPFDAVTLFLDPSVNFRVEPDPAFHGIVCDAPR